MGKGKEERVNAPAADHGPTASLDVLRERAELLTAVRQYFRDKGYWEVETPILSHDVVVDAHLDPFVVEEPGREFFLQTSPEFGMKRLLAAGADAIFQITRAFRRNERGRLHNPEFTIVEWYRVGDSYHHQMAEVEGLVRSVLNSSGCSSSGELRDTAFARLTYDDAFHRAIGCGVLEKSPAQLLGLASQHKVTIPSGLDINDRDSLLNLLLAELVEPTLGKTQPEFLYDYPASQAALARSRDEIAERFELYIDGIELCNGYQELTDADELASRNLRQAEVRTVNGHRQLPVRSRLIDAMHTGLPDCSGVAMGFDRLAMIALRAESIDDVIPFPFERA